MHQRSRRQLKQPCSCFLATSQMSKPHPAQLCHAPERKLMWRWCFCGGMKMPKMKSRTTRCSLASRLFCIVVIVANIFFSLHPPANSHHLSFKFVFLARNIRGYDASSLAKETFVVEEHMVRTGVEWRVNICSYYSCNCNCDNRTIRPHKELYMLLMFPNPCHEKCKVTTQTHASYYFSCLFHSISFVIFHHCMLNMLFFSLQFRISSALDVCHNWHAKLAGLQTDQQQEDSVSSGSDDGDGPGCVVPASAAPAVADGRWVFRSKEVRICHDKDFKIIRRVLPPTTLGRGRGGRGFDSAMWLMSQFAICHCHWLEVTWPLNFTSQVFGFDHQQKHCWQRYCYQPWALRHQRNRTVCPAPIAAGVTPLLVLNGMHLEVYLAPTWIGAWTLFATIPSYSSLLETVTNPFWKWSWKPFATIIRVRANGLPLWCWLELWRWNPDSVKQQCRLLQWQSMSKRAQCQWHQKLLLPRALPAAQSLRQPLWKEREDASPWVCAMLLTASPLLKSPMLKPKFKSIWLSALAPLPLPVAKVLAAKALGAKVWVWIWALVLNLNYELLGHATKSSWPRRKNLMTSGAWRLCLCQCLSLYRRKS